MTDGIIQKVFKKVLKKYSWKKDGRIFNDSYYDIAVKDITKSLEQELIKEIVNRAKREHVGSVPIGIYIDIDILIGDSK